MNTLIEKRIKATNLDFTDDYMIVTLDDARILQIPLMWYPKLYHSTLEQKRNFRWIGRGSGIEWTELDEHLSVHGFLSGN